MRLSSMSNRSCLYARRVVLLNWGSHESSASALIKKTAHHNAVQHVSASDDDAAHRFQFAVETVL